ncbi:guanine nucleotide exchange protein smcr8b-like isoform X2 [Xenia sp. Carnegie-2017]|uniref:guanine nucleotide exchange protein smcr8b-like isoform X2 n=1 Tax=Xenia sp. Carnegie-2017 TaxID=2897299 RepID=UPI001F04C036|nr:guanine nucleotide exchange protein smcr8b-like isoform X2 [Xenia sp. Carnegie-2017]
MCYISNSKKKIVENMDVFIHEFSKVSRHFKASNQSIFFNELKRRLADIKYVKDCNAFHERNSDNVDVSQNAGKNFHSLSAETIEAMLEEANVAISVLTTTNLTNNKKSKDLSSMSGHLNEMPTFVSNGRDTSGYQLSNGGQIHDEIVDRLLRDTNRHQLILRDLHGLCGYRATEGLASLQRIHQHFYQPYEVFSLINEETPLLDPFSSTLAIGGSFTMNFRSDIEMYNSDARIGLSMDSKFKGSDLSDISSESFPSYLDENSSDGEIQSQHKKHCFIQTPFSLITNKDLMGEMNLADLDSNESSSFSNITLSWGEGTDDSTTSQCLKKPTSPLAVSPPEPVLHRGSVGDLASVAEDIPSRFHRRESTIESQSSNASNFGDDGLSATMSASSRVKDSEELSKIFAPFTSPKYQVVYKDVCHVASSSDSFGYGTGDKRMKKSSLQCYAQQLGCHTSDGPGGGVLRLLKHDKYLVHLLFALFTGRCLVVQAEPAHQRKVVSMITSLWLFVPGNCRGSQQVIPWRTKPLKLSDLGRIKLVGLAKSKQFNPLPKSVEAYVSTFDFESKTLVTPPYKGKFLCDILATRRNWKSDSLFLSYIHSVFLEITLKTFVCYYAISLRSSTTDSNLPWKQRTLVPREFSRQYLDDVFDLSGVLGSDTQIILYFLDLITQQQLSDFPLLGSLTDSTSQDSFISLESFRSTDMIDSSTHVTKIGPILLDYTKRAVYPKM